MDGAVAAVSPRRNTNQNTVEVQPSEILSDIVIYTKYARYIETENRRETWDEIVDRNHKMHRDVYKERLGADAFEELVPHLNWAYEYVRSMKILPSMRSAQFAGKPIKINPSRVYNCAYLPIDDIAAFSETMFLLLGGTGVGYSVQSSHVEKLPALVRPVSSRRFLLGDSIEGWADGVKILFKAYFAGGSKPIFDPSDIRDKGSRLVTSGGKAPGPEPLMECLRKIEALLESKESGDKLSAIDCHDILCFIADAVLTGGIRRAALISLFSINDEQMLAAKSNALPAMLVGASEPDEFGSVEATYIIDGRTITSLLSEHDYSVLVSNGTLPWYIPYPHRGRANNSVVLDRSRITRERFDYIWKLVKDSKAGEPGFYFTNNPEYGTNPCCEISLRPFQFCNLCTIPVTDIESQEDFEQRCMATAIIGTLQAGYTDFHYLRDIWKRNTEKDSLIATSMTGIAGKGIVLDEEAGAKVINETNDYIAKLIGINPAARTTALKPEGTSSLAAGRKSAVSSGVHGYHDEYWNRRMRMNKTEPIYDYLMQTIPDLVEDEVYGQGAVVSIPQKAPEGAITRHESAIEFLERVKYYNLKWVRPGHREGPNTNNVSATVSIKDHEWEAVGEWFWHNRNYYNGLSVLPFDGGTYVQAPFETIDKETYEKMLTMIRKIDLTQIIETFDGTDLKGEIACGPAGCEVL